MKLQKARELVVATVASWIDDRAPSMGAALAYYTAFSIAPLLLIVISIAGLAFGEEAARGEIVGQLSGLMGDDAARAVQDLVASVHRPAHGTVATLVGVGALLVGATSVFAELQGTLDRIWRAPARVRPSGWLALLRTRLLSFGMVLGMGFLLTVSLVVSAALAALARGWAPLFEHWVALAHAVDVVLGLATTTALFALVYKVMPSVHVRWHDVWVGAAVTALLFTVGRALIGAYLGRSSVASGFGAAGSLAVMLVWVYYSAQVFLLGAEFTWVWANTVGSRSGADPSSAGAVSRDRGLARATTAL